MDAKDFFEHAKQSLTETTKKSRPVILERLAEQYIGDKALHSEDTLGLLVAESLKLDTLLAQAATEKYDKHTRPRFVLPIVFSCTVIGWAAMTALPEGNQGTWITVMIVGMLYICLRLLPGWRKRLPKLREAVTRLAENAIDAASDERRPEYWDQARANRLIIKTILTSARYKNPFPQWSDQLLALALPEEKE